MQSPLTAKQQRVLDYLHRKVSQSGQIPSLRQSAKDLKVSHTAVAQAIKALEEKGHLKRKAPYSRTVYLLNPVRQTAAAQRWQEIPIVGRITAGLPMYAQQEWEGSVLVDAALFRGRNLFALTVKGDSMQAAGILDGDLALCEPRQYARNGEIVVALIDDEEATVKRFFLHPEGIELRPENPRYAAMHYGFERVLIQGKVIGIQRGPEGFR